VGTQPQKVQAVIMTGHNMTQLYQLTAKELAFLDALASERDLGRRMVENGLVSVTGSGLTLTCKGAILLEQAHAEGALPRPKPR
jgi:hypothetical protein